MSNFEDQATTSGERFDDGFVGEREIVFGFVVVEDEDGFGLKGVFDGGVVEELGEKN